MARFGGISFGRDQETSRWNFENRMQISGLGLPALPWETGVFSQIFVPGQTPEGLRLPAIYPQVNPLLLWSLMKKKQPRFQLLRFRSLHVVCRRCLIKTMKVAKRLCGLGLWHVGLGSSKEADLNRWLESTSLSFSAQMTQEGCH